MKASVLLLTICLALLCASCEKSHDPDAGLPEITFVSFEGIPANHVELDQLHKTITIKVSDLLPEQGLVPKLKTSPGAVITQGLTPGGKLDLKPFCTCFGYNTNPHPGAVESQLVLIYENKVTGDELTTTYRVILSSPKGRLKPIENIPITYAKIPGGEYNFIQIDLPVRNLYQNLYVTGIRLTNAETGVEHGYIIVGPNCANSCEAQSANRMTLVYNTDLRNKLTSGTYEIAIRTTGNTDFVVFPQPFVFSR